MTLTIELTRDQEARLQAEASATGSDPQTVLRNYVDTLPAPGVPSGSWGASVVDKWRREGLLGAYGDMNKDSPEAARELRAKVEDDLFCRDADAA
jgi:hypothetical protein